MSVNILRFIIPKSKVEYINRDSTVRQALEKMLYHKYTALPIIDGEGRYVGTLSKDDLFRYLLASGDFDRFALEEISVMELVDESYSKPLYQNATLADLIEQVKEHNFVPVVDDRHCFIGLILRRDVLNYLLKFYKDDN